MNSRYDYMKDSVVCDPEDGVPYPDVLTTNYSDVNLTKIPTITRMTAADIQRMWKFMYDNYGIAYYDDLLLNINGIGYVGEIEPGTQLVKIDIEDLKNFNENKRKEVE